MHIKLTSILFHYLGWALIQIPDFLLFVYCHVKEFFKTKNHAKAGPIAKNQKMSRNVGKWNKRTHEMDNSGAKNKDEPMDNVNNEFGHDQRISKLKSYLESQIENLIEIKVKAEFQKIKE